MLYRETALDFVIQRDDNLQALPPGLRAKNINWAPPLLQAPYALDVGGEFYYESGRYAQFEAPLAAPFVIAAINSFYVPEMSELIAMILNNAMVTYAWAVVYSNSTRYGTPEGHRILAVEGRWRHLVNGILPTPDLRAITNRIPRFVRLVSNLRIRWQLERVADRPNQVIEKGGLCRAQVLATVDSGEVATLLLLETQYQRSGLYFCRPVNFDYGQIS
ncbi:MAG: hypothetical protein WC553_00025 [Patescibacteria group bacterium]|jgi:hypothetical protein